MATLTPIARQQIKDSGLTIAGYIRHWSSGSKWRGDACGCPDDRCIGFHHDEREECGCLPVTIAEVQRMPKCPICSGGVELTPSGFLTCLKYGSEHYRVKA